MAKDSKKIGSEASLKRRQLNGINNIATSHRDAPTPANSNGRMHSNTKIQGAKGKSLLDRMTLPHTSRREDTHNVHVELNTSPKKRKWQRNNQHNGTQIEEACNDHPAKRNKQDDNKIAGEATIHQGKSAAKNPIWENIKSKKRNTSEAVSSKQTEDKGIKSLTPQATPTPKEKTSAHNNEASHSPSSKQSGTRLGKRGADEREEPQHAHKKSRTSVTQKTTFKATMEPVDAATAKERQAYTDRIPFSPVVANPDFEHVYRDYGDDSIPLLFAMQARDGRQHVLLNEPSLDLRCRALALLDSPKGFAANDLGRPNAPKRGRTKVIDDLDLYLMEDGKVYVGTERGLLLVADYLKLAGVLDTTPVRFNGIKPAYVKASPYSRSFRWVSITTYDPSVRVEERAKMLPGELPLFFGEMVEVWEFDSDSGKAFGKLLHDGQTGWFDLKNTVATRREMPPIEPWDETVYEEKDFLFSRNDPPAPSAALASLKFVKTYRCSQPEPPAEAADIISPKATTPLVANKPSSRSTKPVELSNLKNPSPNKSISHSENEAPKEEQADVKFPAVSTDEEAKLNCPSSESGLSGAGKNVEHVEKDTITAIQKDSNTVPEIGKIPISRTHESSKQEAEQTERASSKSSGAKSSVQRSMHDHSVEDEVDWDDDEL